MWDIEQFLVTGVTFQVEKEHENSVCFWSLSCKTEYFVPKVVMHLELFVSLWSQIKEIFMYLFDKCI